MHRCDIGNYLGYYKTDYVCWSYNVRGIEFLSLIVDGKNENLELSILVLSWLK